MSRRKKPARPPKPARQPRQRRPSRIGLWWSQIDPAQKRLWLGGAGWCVLAIAAVIGSGVALARLERQVSDSAANLVVGAKFTHRPVWMPMSLATEIVRDILPANVDYNDEQFTSLVYESASANPWIRCVRQVRKYRSAEPLLGVAELDVEFREPAARVLYDGGDYFVDADGVRLPSDQVPRYAAVVAGGDGVVRTHCYIDEHEAPPSVQVVPIHYIAIRGVDVASSPAPPPGRKWRASDLQEGLRLVRIVLDRPYANQISVVDVRNHNGRISRVEPHLRMYAQIGQTRATDIRFGRFPNPGGDWEVAPDRKLYNLDQYVRDNNGQLAGVNGYIDLRYDPRHDSYN